MGIKNVMKKVANRAGDRVAKLSQLSPYQVEEVCSQREEYLSEEPDPTNEAEIEKLIAASGIEIYNAYLSQIKELYLPIEVNAEYDAPFAADYNIRYINITKWVNDTKENSLEKLVNVYAVLSDEECNIALVFNRTRERTDVYLAIVNTRNDDNNVNANHYKDRIVEAIRGNFPGAEWEDDGKGILPCLDNDKHYTVATASNIPTEKSEKFVSQTIEKLLDGIVPDSKKSEYTIVLLATPIQDVEERKLKLGEYYSGLAPYASWQTDFHFTDNQSFGSQATVGVNLGASAGIQNGTNTGSSESDGTTESDSRSNTDSTGNTLTDGTSTADSSSSSHADGTSQTNTTTDGTSGSRGISTTNTTGSTSTTTNTTGESQSNSLGGHIGGSIGRNNSANVGINAGINAGLSTGVNVGLNAGVSMGHTSGTNSSVAEGISSMQNLSEGLTENSGWSLSNAQSMGTTASDTLTQGLTNTVTNSVAKTAGKAISNTLGKAVTKTMATTSGITKGFSLGANFGANFARSSTVTAMVGKNEGITQSFVNYNIKHALELLESQMKRLEQSSALGMWDFAAYVLSEDQNVANNVAHSYLALTLGEESYLSKSAINLWRGSVEDEKESAKVIASYIRQLRHPMFGLNPDLSGKDEQLYAYPPIVTATTSLSGKELAYSLNFPRRSISGLPILECAEFGRNVVTYDKVPMSEQQIRLGNIFHMNHEERTEVDLSLESLRSHAFITGSTGAGKSNTIYHLLDMARDAGAHFLVIEPAKGEYKQVFGMDDDVSVYGTNPMLTPLLRLNPFSFPKKVHILEHMDRLIEIFNVCWPMYAAMPAVLKSAVEKSYVDCGWDLVASTNKHDEGLYPDFSGVARNVKTIIDSSEYDQENKGAYKGSLLTRLQSLTTGINGLIFTSDDVPDGDLFEKNVIVDLSRVGSSETKSLIMGILVLKLQEFRMSSELPMNSELRHLTVLEEAHHLLRRTPTEQSTESANILGKSVEMIANAIAEMRTYGEGFLIADQAPGLMDMSVIRNTNTKIIMRLPDQGDRELVGRSANLNEDQIKELSKLPCGVAAVYQNEWVQPVLCKVERFDGKHGEYRFDPSGNDILLEKDKGISDSLLKSIMDKELLRHGEKEDLRELKGIILRSRLATSVKVDLMDYLQSEGEDGMEMLGRLAYDFLNAKDAIQETPQHGDIHEWVDEVLEKLDPPILNYSKRQVDLAVLLILDEQARRDASSKNLLNSYLEEYHMNGGVF